MANQYKNKIIYGDQTLMDITDTTTTENDVLEGEVFYNASGARSIGTLGDATTSTHGLMSVEDKVKLDNINEIQIDKTIDTPAAIMSFSDGADNLPLSMTVGIEPVQDLHGYDNPWPAGGGKNLFKNTYTSRTVNGVTVTVNDDGSITFNGNASSYAYLDLGTIKFKANTSYIVSKSGFPDSNYYYRLYPADIGIFNNNYTYTPTSDTTQTLQFVIPTNGTFSNKTIYPMIRLSTVSDDTYAPYSNICPISGWTGANVTRTGKNLLDKNAVLLSSYLISTGGIAPSSSGWDTSDYIPVKPGMHLVIKGFASIDGASEWAFYDSSKKFIANSYKSDWARTATAPDGAYYVRIDFMHTMIDTVQLKVGTESTAYEGFKEIATYSITFPSQAGTVYGGELTVNKDGSGSLVVDKAFYTVPQITQDMLITSTTSGSTGLFIKVPTTGTIGGATDDNTYYAICSAAKAKTNATRGGAWTVNAGGEAYTNIWVPSGSTLADLNEKFQGQQIVSTLKTKLTYSLTAPQVKTLLGVNNIWADTGNINSVTYSKQTSGLINTYDKFKLNSLATVSLTGNYNNLLNKPDLSVYLTTVPTMVGATSSAAGTAGLVPAPATTDIDKFLAGDGTYKNGGRPMVILSYGSSTWAQFEEAYNNNVIVYCRASSNSNPASGSQTRMAFMAYVNDASSPTNVEFQYYRSVNSHSSTQMGDQVFIYKLDKTSGWSVTTREASIKEISIDSSSAGSVSWSSNKVTLASGLPKVTASDNGKILKVVDGVWTAVTPD